MKVLSIEMSDFHLQTIQLKTDTPMNDDPKRFCVRLNTKRIEGAKTALFNAARWPAGTLATVKFLEGEPNLQQKVQTVVKKCAYDLSFRDSAFDAEA
jgi:hypothetical protein